jgi:hypothetical protein
MIRTLPVSRRDGLLPADIDGTRRPKNHVPTPIVGIQDNGFPYGAAIDALNIFDLHVQWQANPQASLTLAAQLPVVAFDFIVPCGPTSRGYQRQRRATHHRLALGRLHVHERGPD